MRTLPGGPQSILMNKADDYTTERGANQLVAKIQQFWNRLGKYPQVWAERQDTPGQPNDAMPLWVVRSNMVGGRPI